MLLLPGSLATALSHWSLVRTRKHYPSDVIAGGAIAVIVTAAAWALCPPQRAPRHGADPPADDAPGACAG